MKKSKKTKKELKRLSKMVDKAYLDQYCWWRYKGENWIIRANMN